MSLTSIQIDSQTLEALKDLRKYPRQSYNDLIKELIHMRSTMSNQYDEFLHKVQQDKMKELWDNKDDEFWDTV